MKRAGTGNILFFFYLALNLICCLFWSLQRRILSVYLQLKVKLSSCYYKQCMIWSAYREDIISFYKHCFCCSNVPTTGAKDWLSDLCYAKQGFRSESFDSPPNCPELISRKLRCVDWVFDFHFLLWGFLCVLSPFHLFQTTAPLFTVV